MLKKKRRFSIRSVKKPSHTTEGVIDEGTSTHRKKSRKAKSFSKSINQNGLKLPDIDLQERSGISSANTTRLKKVYGSTAKEKESLS